MRLVLFTALRSEATREDQLRATDAEPERQPLLTSSLGRRRFARAARDREVDGGGCADDGGPGEDIGQQGAGLERVPRVIDGVWIGRVAVEFVVELLIAIHADDTKRHRRAREYSRGDRADPEGRTEPVRLLCRHAIGSAGRAC